MTAQKDCWARWVASMRPPPESDRPFGPPHPHAVWRERVLDNAEPVQDRVVLDVGCGEGLVAFGALERGARRVLFADISRDLLDFCRERAAELGLLNRCRFVESRAESLGGIDDSSVDAVTTRSVLIYVADKRAAFHEFARVLRSGGRISLFEPINRFARVPAPSWAGFDLSPLPEIAAKIRAVYDAIQPPDTDPMLDFDERDLLALAEEAGLRQLRLELEAEIRPTEPMPWDEFASRAGNPRIPTIAEAMEEALTIEERARLVAHLRPLVEEGRGTWRMAVAFLSGVKQ